jgi:uncharacterized membrane protein
LNKADGRESVVDKIKSDNLDYHHDEVFDAFDDLEKNYRHTHPVGWWMALVGPVVVTAVLLGLITMFQGRDVALSYVGAAGSAFFLFGRFIIMLGQTAPDPESWGFLKYLDAPDLFLMLTYLDVMVAMFVAFHMGIVFRIPWVGPRIEDIVSDGHFILRKQPWIRRAAFIGLICFVIFPTSTTGSVGGSIFGRLLGMKRARVVTAILIGSILGNGLMLLFSNQISQYVQGDSWVLRVFGAAAMIVALFFFERKFRRIKNEYIAQERLSKQLEASQPADSDPSTTTELPSNVTNS